MSPIVRTYRPCVGMMVFNHQGQIFVGQRNDMISEAWQMPQGGIDPGETPEEAALRELKEEIGTAQVHLIKKAPQLLYYDLPRELQDRLWDGQYKGQVQQWFLYVFTGNESDIDVTITKEFKSWKWCSLDKLISYAVPFKATIYKEIIKVFSAEIEDHLSS